MVVAAAAVEQVDISAVDPVAGEGAAGSVDLAAVEEGLHDIPVLGPASGLVCRPVVVDLVPDAAEEDHGSAVEEDHSSAAEEVSVDSDKGETAVVAVAVKADVEDPAVVLDLVKVTGAVQHR